MAKITIADIIGGFASVLGLNSRFQQIENELNNKVLYRNNPGSETNEMNNALDMNGYEVINLPEPTDPTSPVRLLDIGATGSLGASKLSELDDVDHNLSPLDFQTLIYNETNAQFEAGAIPGFSAIGLDYLTDVDTVTAPPTNLDVLTYVNATGKWEPRAVAGGGGSGRVQLTSDVSYTVGPTGDFATVKQALNFVLDTYSSPQVNTTKAGAGLYGDNKAYTVTLTLQAGFVWTEQLTVANTDASWIRISSTDATVTVDTTGWTDLYSGTQVKALWFFYKAKSPLLDINVSTTSVASQYKYISAWQSEVSTRKCNITGFHDGISLAYSRWVAFPESFFASYTFDVGGVAIGAYSSQVDCQLQITFSEAVNVSIRCLDAFRSTLVFGELIHSNSTTLGNGIFLDNSHLTATGITFNNSYKDVYLINNSTLVSGDIDLTVVASGQNAVLTAMDTSQIYASSAVTLTHGGTAVPLIIGNGKVNVASLATTTSASNHVTVDGGELICDGSCNSVIALQTKGAAVKLAGVWTGSSATPKNTLTSAGIIYN